MTAKELKLPSLPDYPGVRHIHHKRVSIYLNLLRTLIQITANFFSVACCTLENSQHFAAFSNIRGGKSAVRSTVPRAASASLYGIYSLGTQSILRVNTAGQASAASLIQSSALLDLRLPHRLCSSGHADGRSYHLSS